MSDPRYAHKFFPNKNDLCKQIVGSEYCHKPKDDIVHVRHKITFLCEICGKELIEGGYFIVINYLTYHFCEEHLEDITKFTDTKGEIT